MGVRMEIITGVERRRRWRTGDKLRILAELDEAGVRFNDVARRHDLSRGLLWQWREAHRRGQLVEDVPVFLPLRVVPDGVRPAPPSIPAPLPPPAVAPAGPLRREAAGAGRIEIVLPDSTTVRVGAGVGTAALRRVLGALRG